MLSNSMKTIIQIIVLVAAFGLMIPGLMWVFFDRSAAEKAATALVLPTGFCWVVLGAATIVLLRRRLRSHAVLTGTVWLVLSVAGNGLLCGRLAGELEGSFTNTDPFRLQPMDYMVVLGGGAAEGRNGVTQGNSSGDRILLAARLYHSGQAKRLICSGRRISSMTSQTVDPADQTRELLIQLAVPADVIEIAAGRNTSEEMRLLADRFGGQDIRLGVLSSAWHLPRVLRLAETNGLHPIPVPADFMTGPPDRTPTTAGLIVACIPQGESLSALSRIAKEKLAGLAGR